MGIFAFRYDWDSWLNGDSWYLDPMMQVNKNRVVFKNGLRKQLRKRGLHGAMKLVQTEFGERILVQAWTGFDRPDWVTKKDFVA